MLNGQGLILSAPASGSGKTTLTLGILRALSRRHENIRSAKSGPDYIDPRFHAAASGRACLNLDAWAMTPARLADLASGPGTLMIEGAMGLFDGAPPDGRGATADLARHLGLPVVLILDCARQSHSMAAVVEGFAAHRSDVKICGLILNNTGSERHEAMLHHALSPLGLPVLGAIRRMPGLAHPSRHLGLVQADERPDLQVFLDRVADTVEAAVDLDALLALARPLPAANQAPGLPPPAQRISIARDAAFAFAYPHLMADWRSAGAEISEFSPLADQVPPSADMVFLPGGYPELHAGRLAGNRTFLNGLRQMARDTPIYGECGGYMVLGEGLVDRDGQRHQMAGLLRLETSFQAPKLHLGYRRLTALGPPWQGQLAAHEFHYASTIRAKGEPLFQAQNAEGENLPAMGLQQGRVSGSFAHIIDAAR
ncbi:MAG: cobyrinate a,c-diamide synthase [Rhodobacteraceae bacterium]|nr:cobyrinate a,c-diamide synthase [Paracoccaceae bacterium]